MNRYQPLIQECDKLIRNGQAIEACRQLSQINPIRVPRALRLDLAKLCRRTGLNTLGMRLLDPVVKQPRGGEGQASAAELTEYAVILLRSGAIPEALERLRHVDPHQVPDALLYRAFGHFAQWEYQEAIPLLESYVNEPLSAYANLVGLTNLASALVECRKHDRAMALLQEIIKHTRSEGHSHLQSTCHALCAQVHMQAEDFAAAQLQLESARQLFPLTQLNDHFFITRLTLIINGLKNENQGAFEELRRLSIAKRSFGNLRDADLFSLKIGFDPQRFLHLYFGSPFVEFRKRMTIELGREVDRTTYVLGLKSAPRMDMQTGKIDGKSVLHPGGKIHQVLEVLLRDFYQPLRIAGLFSRLFPHEHFNVRTSPPRVHQLLWRTRHWLVRQSIPISINESHGFFSLKIEGDFSFRIPLERHAVDVMGVQLSRLQAAFPIGVEFSNRQAQLCLGLSESTVQRVFNWAIAAGHLAKTGVSKQTTRYKILSPELQKSA